MVVFGRFGRVNINMMTVLDSSSRIPQRVRLIIAVELPLGFAQNGETTIEPRAVPYLYQA